MCLGRLALVRCLAVACRIPYLLTVMLDAGA